MRRLATTTKLAVAVALWAGGEGLRGQDAGGRAFVELTTPRTEVYLGEAVDVTVRIGFVPAFARENLIQLFRRHTDLAARVDTPWREGIDGFGAATAVEGLEPPDLATAVLDGTVGSLRRAGTVRRAIGAAAEGPARERTFALFETTARLVPERAGTLRIPPAALQFAWADGFEEDFFGERQPKGREDARLGTQPLEISVRELPEEGRPAGFTGLVGAVELVATIEGPEIEGPEEVKVGEALTLRLSVRGSGDLTPFEPPLLDAPPHRAFHVRGMREERGPGRRDVLYDLVALRSDATAVAPVSVAFFDPVTARYGSARSAAVAVTVRPSADGVTAVDAGGNPVPLAGEDDAEPEPPEDDAPAAIPGVDVLFGIEEVNRIGPPGSRAPDLREPDPRPWLVVGAVLLGLAFALCLWWWQRRAGTREERRRRRARRHARAALERTLAAPGADRGAALCGYLAAWLDCAPAAIVDPALPERLRRAGVQPATAREVDGALDALAADRFGAERGAAPADSALRDLVARLDAQLRAAASAPHPAATARTAAKATLGLAPAFVLLLAHSAAGQGDPAAHTAARNANESPSPLQAQRFFAAGDIARAAGVYRQLLDEGGWDPAPLCLDLGNCAHELGRPAEAVLWYSRALRADPTHFRARANLQLVRRQLGLDGSGDRALGRVWLEGAADRLASLPLWVPLLAVVLLQVAGWWLCLVRRRRTAGALLVALGLALAAAMLAPALTERGEAAVVLRAGVRMQAQPHERAGAVATLDPGQTVRVLESSTRWARIRREADAGGDEGWVEADSIEPVALGTR